MDDLGGFLVAVRKSDELIEYTDVEVQGTGNCCSLVVAKMKGSVGVLNGRWSTWSSHREPRLKLSRECCFQSCKAAPVQIPPLMQSRLTSQWEGCSPSSRWQGVAAAKFSGLPGSTVGPSTYRRTDVATCSKYILRSQNG